MTPFVVGALQDTGWALPDAMATCIVSRWSSWLRCSGWGPRREVGNLRRDGAVAHDHPRPFGLVRYVWALPNTLVGLLFVPVAVLQGSGLQVVTGVVEIHGPLIAAILRRCIPIPGGASAITFRPRGPGMRPDDARRYPIARESPCAPV